MTTKVSSNELSTTGVSAGSYGGSANTVSLVIDSAGRITSASNNAVSKLTTANWTISESGGKLYFAYGGVNKFSLDSTGTLIAANNVTAAGTP